MRGRSDSGQRPNGIIYAADRNSRCASVRRFARAATWQQAAPTWSKRPGILDSYRVYLQQRREEGEHNIAALHREITARGFTGSEATVRLYLTTLRQTLDAGVPPPALIPSVSQVTRGITARPETLNEERRTALKQLLDHCPELATVYDRVRSFAAVLAKGSANLLHRWITKAKADGIPQLTTYAAGLADDLGAVRAGVTLPHSSGVIEGRVTDLIKRQMGGRADIPLLRKRVILVAHSRRILKPRTCEDPWMINGYENLV